jgi:HEAT repeat protein
MENKVKLIAVDEIMSIYKSHSNKRDIVIEALGEVGGEYAIKAILSIYKSHSNKRDLIIRALGHAGKNS